MIVIFISILVLLHVSACQFYFGIISPEQFIVILYVINIFLIACVLECALQTSNSESSKNENVLTNLRGVRHDLIKHKSPLNGKDRNLYIEWWKKRVIYQTQAFPLDRLAYLSAKYSTCSNDTCFLLRASQTKQLVKKPDYRSDVHCYEKYYDDPHPLKLVNNLSRTYIHRRAEFFRKRDVCSAECKQITIRGKKKRFIPFEEDSDYEECTHKLSITEKLMSNYKIIRNTFTRGTSDDTTTMADSSDDQRKVKRKAAWKKCVTTLCPKRSSRNNSSDDSSDSEEGT